MAERISFSLFNNFEVIILIDEAFIFHKFSNIFHDIYIYNDVRKKENKTKKYFIQLPNTKMRKGKGFRESPEPGGDVKEKLKKAFAGFALFSTLLLGKVGEGMAQEVGTQERKEYGKEIVVQPSTEVQSDTLVSGDDVPRGPDREPDPVGEDKPTTEPEGNDEGEKGQTSEDEEKQPDEKGGIAVHGMLYAGTGVAGDFAEVCSDKGTLIAVVDMSHPQTGLGFTGIRLDDFHNDPDQPASRATVLNLHWNKKFGRFGLGVEGKYTFIDHLPQANGFSPDVVLSYTTDGGRRFEGMYAHKFKTGEDSEAFRLTIEKGLSKALKITGQGWYETGYQGHFYGRIIVDINLGNGFGAQLSCIFKNGQLTPTAGIIYQF